MPRQAGVPFDCLRSGANGDTSVSNGTGSHSSQGEPPQAFSRRGMMMSCNCQHWDERYTRMLHPQLLLDMGSTCWSCCQPMLLAGQTLPGWDRDRRKSVKNLSTQAVLVSSCHGHKQGLLQGLVLFSGCRCCVSLLMVTLRVPMSWLTRSLCGLTASQAPC